MGRTKATLELEGRTFLVRVVDALRRGGCDEVVVVVDRSNQEVRLEAEQLGVTVLENPHPGEGPITSLRLALSGLSTDVDGIAWLPLDHALVDDNAVRRLLEASTVSGAPLTLPMYGAKRGHPAVFRRTLFPELTDPALDGGARTVVHRHLEDACLVAFDHPGVIEDIDTPEAYDRVRASLEASGSTQPLSAAEAAELLLATSSAGGTAAVATLVGAVDGTRLGARLARVRESGTGDLAGHTSRGQLGSVPLEEAAVRLLDEAILDARAPDGVRTVDLAGGAELYIEIRRPIRELIVVGAGHVAQPMAHLGALLGYRVTVLDDRPDFATQERFPDAERLVRADFSDPFADVSLHERSHLLLVTRGHKYDYECLIRALRTDPPPAYIGMIGSRRRVRATYVQLVEEGFDSAALERIHAPVGLDIGAETPEEIAVAVAAELVMLDRGGRGTPLRQVERVAERFFSDTP
jgi:xanthine dehydrogenase accessory factor